MKIAIFLGLVLFAVMASCGKSAIEESGRDVPEKEVVTIEPPPKIITRTEYVTEYITQPMPEPCLAAIEMVDRVVNSSADVNRSGSKIETKMESITTDQMSDPQAAYKYQDFLYRAVQQLEEDLTVGLESQYSLERYMARCEEEMSTQ